MLQAVLVIAPDLNIAGVGSDSDKPFAHVREHLLNLQQAPYFVVRVLEVAVHQYVNRYGQVTDQKFDLDNA